MQNGPDSVYLDGHLLIAMPGMQDDRFARAVVYVCAHSEDGAMGIIVNKTAPDIAFADLLTQLQIVKQQDGRNAAKIEDIRIHHGGPVETGRGFVLHSADYFLENATLMIANDVCLTATLDILRAIADGSGPDEAFLALGYAGWAPTQLEAEIQANGWLHGPADTAILFDDDVGSKYDRALAKIGVDPAMLSIDAGHA
ncbi:MAG: YqgE/AlgH family protein [Hyphomicrobiales bacterium]|nr:YqgE/AlgH family protein [Hyphomicrobiales bacterium]